MKEVRRQFLHAASAIFACVASGIRTDAKPQSRKMPAPPQPADSDPMTSENANSRVSQRAIFQQHDKQFRDSVAALFAHVNELEE